MEERSPGNEAIKAPGGHDMICTLYSVVDKWCQEWSREVSQEWEGPAGTEWSWGVGSVGRSRWGLSVEGSGELQEVVWK